MDDELNNNNGQSDTEQGGCQRYWPDEKSAVDVTSITFLKSWEIFSRKHSGRLHKKVEHSEKRCQLLHFFFSQPLYPNREQLKTKQTNKKNHVSQKIKRCVFPLSAPSLLSYDRSCFSQQPDEQEVRAGHPGSPPRQLLLNRVWLTAAHRGICTCGKNF